MDGFGIIDGSIADPIQGGASRETRTEPSVRNPAGPAVSVLVSLTVKILAGLKMNRGLDKSVIPGFMDPMTSSPVGTAAFLPYAA